MSHRGIIAAVWLLFAAGGAALYYQADVWRRPAAAVLGAFIGAIVGVLAIMIGAAVLIVFGVV